MDSTQQQPQHSTMPSTPPRAVHHRIGWNDLPTELKLIILEDHLKLKLPKILVARNHQIILDMRLRSLLQANIEGLTSDAMQVFYQSNTFGYSTVDFGMGLRLPFSSSSHIEQLELTVSRLPRALLPSYDPSLYPSRLFDSVLNYHGKTDKELQAEAQNWRSLWKNDFPMLRSLHLVLEISDVVKIRGPMLGEAYELCTLHECVMVLKSNFAHLNLETLTVTVLSDKDCPGNNPAHETGACQCVKQLEDSIATDMMSAHTK